MSNDVLSARLVEYLVRYTTFPMPSRDAQSRGRVWRAQIPRALPASAVLRGAGASVLAVAVIAALVVVLAVGFGSRTRSLASQPQPSTLFGGAPASVVANPRNNYVWFTGTASAAVEPIPASQGGTAPAPGSQPGVSAAGLRVAVLDWTGTVRYRFTIGRSRLDPSVFPAIESISTDGTRALLDDGAVLDQTGAVVGSIPALENEAAGAPRWTPNAREVCAAVDSEGHLSLRIYELDGTSRLIGSVPDPVNESGVVASSTSVLACDPESNLAIVGRYNFQAPSTKTCSASPGECTYTVEDVVVAGIWALQISTGTVLLHVPAVVVADGEPFFFGSENGALAAGFVDSGSSTTAAETDVVLRIPSGNAVHGLPNSASPNLPDVSADGTRILATVENATRTRLTFYLVRASDGVSLRSVTIYGANLSPASAAAYPEGSSFMIEVDGQLALLDASGRVSRLATTLDLGATPADLDFESMSLAQR